MAPIIQLTSGASMKSQGVIGCTKSWEANERDQQFGETESIHIGRRQRLQRVGNARINQVLAMTQGLTKIVQTVRISRYFKSSDTDLHIAENACCIHYADTWSSK